MSRWSFLQTKQEFIGRFACTGISFALLFAGREASAAARIDFNRDIRPVMADTCFRCHGFDANTRKAGVRLDLRSEALKPSKSGAVPIAPGDPEKSELVRRLFSEEEGVRMPPPEIHKELTPAQKETFRRWIAEGAEYREHWAFSPPGRPELPAIDLNQWPTTAIDHFILNRLESRNIKPAPRADRTTLIRRVSLDLTGLPPTPDEVRAFFEDPSPRAYERLVDRLLASPRYGERMAQEWLDAARFADSNGYQVDRDRELWAWREWVVKALNDNMPFDKFTLEQLAGDLLPDPSIDQRIATGFHRNHMINEEGGIIAEEFLAEYCADRVETTATVWLGLTMNCARCHDHKYDPITQKDFYSLLAFFHNVPENGVGDYSANIRRNTPPFLKLPAPEAEAALARLRRELEEAQARQTAIATNALQDGAAWAARANAAKLQWSDADASFSVEGQGPPQFLPRGSWLTIPPIDKGEKTLNLVARLPLKSLTAARIELKTPQGESNSGESSIAIKELRLHRSAALLGSKAPLKLVPKGLAQSAPDASIAKALDGKAATSWTVSSTKEGMAAGVFEITEPVRDESGVLITLELDVTPDEKGQTWQLRLQGTDMDRDLLLTPTLAELVRKPAGERNAEEQATLDKFRLARSPAHAAIVEQVAELKKQVDAADLAIPITLVMAERPEPRPTHVLMRGAYDKPGELVGMRTPSFLQPFAPDLPKNRLGLARWILDPGNPLTARVIVNRYWQSIFGIGLVRTSEDFGVQGEPPSHPELLDWLAQEFVRTGWDVKRMIKLFVMSATYRQESRTTSAQRALDPDNRLLARGPRYRLPAEAIRDQALAVSGLLSEKLGGPSVKPYHPPGLYEQVVAGSSASTYIQGKGVDLYRRSLYTYWKRSVPNPAMLAFDAPFRETCAVRRSRTSTPLQALNLLNDPTYVESARSLAQRMMREGGKTMESRIRHGFQLVLARPPSNAELGILTAGFRRREAGFRADPSSASKMIGVGESKPDVTWDPVKLAAYATVASALLNLDETITKE